MRTIKTFLMMVSIVFLFEIVCFSPNDVAAQRCDPNRYRMDPKLRKKLGREALTKAMELNARVELMIHQGSDQFEKMNSMLNQSYAEQIKAIGAIEGLVRESCFKDPSMIKGIESMYTEGKPFTMQGAQKIKNGDGPGALESLARAKLAHHRFMIFMY
jgi:hypothetical protein